MHRQTCVGMAVAVTLVMVQGLGGATAPWRDPPAGATTQQAANRPGKVHLPPPRPDDLFVCAPVGSGQVVECYRP